MSKLEVLADKVLKLQTPDKLRFAAGLLEETNQVNTAIVVIQRALDELKLVKLLGGIPPIAQPLKPERKE